jgi:hypothetical protein
MSNSKPITVLPPGVDQLEATRNLTRRQQATADAAADRQTANNRVPKGDSQ